MFAGGRGGEWSGFGFSFAAGGAGSGDVLEIVDQTVDGALLYMRGVLAELTVDVKSGAIWRLLHDKEGGSALEAQMVLAAHDDHPLGGPLTLGTVNELGTIHI